MADKSISELAAATEVTAADLFVLEQSGQAKKFSGQQLANWLVAMADGHGGINNIAKTATSGLVDLYTITYADTTTNTFTVTNGAKGDTGAQTYVWIKYASVKPTVSSHTMSDTPDAWMGIHVGTENAAPGDYTKYTWYQIKGTRGDDGTSATLVSCKTEYSVSGYRTDPPESWSETVPMLPPGTYLWTKSTITFNTGDPVVTYIVTYNGEDGAVSSVNGVYPTNGALTLKAINIKTETDMTLEAALANLYYKPGDVFTNDGGMILTGYVAGSQKTLRFVVPVSKRLDNITSARITAFSGIGRNGNGGYTNATAGSNPVNFLASVTSQVITINKEMGCLEVLLTATSNFGTNNMPVFIYGEAGSISITLS